MNGLTFYIGLMAWLGLSPALAQYGARSYRYYQPATVSNPDEWISREVDSKRQVIVTYKTWNEIVNDEPINRRSVVSTEPIPKDYQPGDLEAKLPAPPFGATHVTQDDAQTGLTTVWAVSEVTDWRNRRVRRHKILVTEPTKPKKTTAPALKPPVEVPPPVQTEEPKVVSEATPARAIPTAKAEEKTDILPRYPGSEAPKRATAKPIKEATAPETRTAKKPKLRPPSELGKAPLVGESAADLVKPLEIAKPLPENSRLPEKKKKSPPPLVLNAPKASLSVDWVGERKKLSSSEREELVQLLKVTQSECARWQNDLSKRMITCAEGKCLVRDRGDGDIEVPYQVGVGRVWLLRTEAQYLQFALENDALSSQEQYQETLQMVRRIDSLEAHLKYSHGSSKSDYLKKLEENIDDWRDLTADWNIYDSPGDKNWVLRWQILTKDAAVVLERLPRVQSALAEINSEMGPELHAGLKSFLKKAGTRPWHLAAPEQYELARSLYFEITARLRAEYRALARHSDQLLTDPDTYIDMQVLLGAAENLAVYAWTIMEELAAQQAEEEK